MRTPKMGGDNAGTTALLAIGWMFGAVPASTLLEAAAAFVAINLCLYLAIRSGFNLRFEEPSLTRLQILAAITVLMYIVYQINDGRDVALFGCFIVFLFGVFRLNDEISCGVENVGREFHVHGIVFDNQNCLLHWKLASLRGSRFRQRRSLPAH